MCDKCNYKFSDVLITNQNEPMEHKYKITAEKDMYVRVIRSSTATIELPELGIKIEPGTVSEAFISNIEGVLVRALNIIEQANRFSKDETKTSCADDLIQRIEDLRNGKGSATIIIKDPMGNSAIISEKTEKRYLSREETESLETGMTIFEISADEVVKNKKK